MPTLSLLHYLHGCSCILAYTQALVLTGATLGLSRILPVPSGMMGPTLGVTRGNLGAAGSSSTASLIEANAARQLATMEAANPGAHFLSRHGAQTTIQQQYTRSVVGLT